MFVCVCEGEREKRVRERERNGFCKIAKNDKIATFDDISLIASH